MDGSRVASHCSSWISVHLAPGLLSGTLNAETRMGHVSMRLAIDGLPRRMNARKVGKVLSLRDYRSGSRHRSVIGGPASNQAGTEVNATASGDGCVRGHAMVSRSRYPIIEKQYSITKETDCCRKHGLE